MVVVLPAVFFASKLTYTTQVAFFGKSNFTGFPFVINACESSLTSTFFAGSGEPPAPPPLLLPLLPPLELLSSYAFSEDLAARGFEMMVAM